MNAVAKQLTWTSILRFYSEQNSGRITRLGVFEPADGAVTDYWLESGLPLKGIEFDPAGEGHTIIQIMVGDFTHTVSDPRKLLFHFTSGGDEDGVDVIAADGETTVLRFETTNPSN